jgi:hypothetical protein
VLSSYQQSSLNTDIAFTAVFESVPSIPDEPFDITVSGNQTTGNGVLGQTFTPNVGASPTPDPTPITVKLNSLSLFSGANGNSLSETTYLNIYLGNPIGGGTFIGSSTNSLDLDPVLSFDTELVWTFDNLELFNHLTYYAVVSSSNTGIGGTALGYAFRRNIHTNVANFPDYTGGAAVLSGYTLSPDSDLKFTATFGQNASSPYETWATGGELFGDDANDDGVSNGLAFLLGAEGPNANALGLLPAVSEDSEDPGSLVMAFLMRNSTARGSAVLNLQHSSDLGTEDLWTTVAVPETSDGPTSGVTFDIIPGDPLNSVTATIASSEADAGKLFGRLEGSSP